jgi:UDP-4-amino-4,6-dideoxy-N-acetyl-beta-L-altrosamine N-acetyltransferase
MYTLRPMQESDLSQVLAWRNHPDVRKNMYTQHVISAEEHAAWFARVQIDPTKRYFVCVDDGEPLGVVGFYSISPHHKTAEWAFYSGNLARRGLGSHMEYLALSLAFDELGLEKLSCEVLGFNESVISFHRKHGFRREGIRHQQHLIDGKYEDVHLLALFRKDWLGGLAEQCRRRLAGERDTARLRVGAAQRTTLEVTPQSMARYVEATGDANPLHLSDEVAQRHGFPSRIVHGMLLAGAISKLMGVEFPGPGTIYREQQLSFVKPVLVGETVEVEVRVLTLVGRYATLSTQVKGADGTLRIVGEALMKLGRGSE